MSSYENDVRFVHMSKFTLLREGPMSNAKFDPGGLTKYGFSQVMHPELDVKNLTEEQALQLYYDHYYLASHANEVSFAFGLAIFECAVNQGLDTAIKLWQRACGVVEDGHPGPVSLAALRAFKDSVETLSLFMAFRVQAYIAIQVKNPASYNANNKGWFKRLFLSAYAGASQL